MSKSRVEQDQSHMIFSKLPEVAESVLKQLEKRVREAEEKQFSDEDLLSLHSVYGGVTTQKALEILEKYPTLTAYVTANNLRTLIEIKGDNGRCYRLFPEINFCPCLAFKHQVLERKNKVACKHILAARLAQILGKIEKHSITTEQYLMFLSIHELSE